jgi:hypothetical protein
MRYMLLVYTNEAEMDRATPELMEQVARGHRLVMEEARRAGVFVAAESLAPISSATTVRVVDGQPLVIDGPFAETKEQLAGYTLSTAGISTMRLNGRASCRPSAEVGSDLWKSVRCGFNTVCHEPHWGAVDDSCLHRESRRRLGRPRRGRNGVWVDRPRAPD